MFPGDVLYLPKATIHYATTEPDQVSAHLTVSIDREQRTWQDIITNAALLTDQGPADMVADVLTDVTVRPIGMPWLMVPSYDPVVACQQLTQLVLGFEPWSLRTLLREASPSTTTRAWFASPEINTLLQRLGRCDNQLGPDAHGEMMNGLALLRTNSVEIKQRKRRGYATTVNCGNTCTCNSCSYNSCDDSCVSRASS